MILIVILILLNALILCKSYHTNNIMKYRNSYISCINDNDIEINNELMITYTNNGKERRALRAIATRMKQDSSLLALPCSISYGDSFIRNIKESLEAKEMILLRFNDSGNKKEVKQIMSDICKQSDSEIIQIVGHTALIYKEKSKTSKMRKILNEELERTKD